jgi:hypothetical protein
MMMIIIMMNVLMQVKQNCFTHIRVLLVLTNRGIWPIYYRSDDGYQTLCEGHGVLRIPGKSLVATFTPILGTLVGKLGSTFDCMCCFRTVRTEAHRRVRPSVHTYD